MVINKNFYLVTFSILIGVFLLFLSGKFIFSISWFFVISYITAIFISRLMDLQLSKFTFSFDLLVTIPFLLFITPETVSVILPVIWFITSKKKKILRFSISFLMTSLGTFFYHLANVDYLKIPFFVLGALLANLFWMFIYSINTLKELVNPLVNSYLLIFIGSLIISNVYIFSEIKSFPFFMLIFTYILYLFVIVSYVKSYNIVLFEKIERTKLNRENENFMTLISLVYEDNVEDFDKRLEEILETSCKIAGFEAALMSLFDNENKKVVRIAKSGIPEDVFEKLKNSNVSIDSTMVYFSKRFENEGVYFIPENTISIEEDVSYVFENYLTFDYENSWEPLDLLLVPILNEQNQVVGYISFDKPLSGLRPSINELKLLKVLSWFIYQFLKKTPYARFWISKNLKYLSYPEFVRFCDSMIKNSEEVVLAILDIDNFDTINFEKGPEYAEMISKFVEKYFKERKDIFYYKISGENFIFLFPNSTKLKTLMYLGKFYESITEEFGITLSIGLTYDENKGSYFELLNRAREALKVAKKSGGGRIMSL
ncbi:diguanylate cyclase [Thermosipho melanesiensis]|uniref:Diguanylate cyclase n=2 Tax=Thermosipho melanesiensis TaxID=46541 RepID=A6LLJ8_THEM4|nr:diguanylate cyclase [Thermosipho melanesiensis]ABR30799.1 diguanylate cyclase [Thermosipho melanesiensis BI429]APT73920.1 diguanylate cyclase [Thermosipho melanesiensis]OOC35858.1 diguanylate cyclase [Thermosipho melanesiensis]OOC38360.1 diguanylate cyclase [Thermosipho melanesiensis]OOC38821.1 diguanylate cyclase [Thermosipho melanesiensis]